MTRPVVAPDTSRLQEACRRAGLRMTHQRLELFRELVGSPGHPSAEELHQRLRERIPTLSLDTVYRTLATFEALGLVRRISSPDHVARYDANPSPHHHLVCVRCRSIEDFSWPAVDELELPPRAAGWGLVQGVRAEVWGVCSACRQRANRPVRLPPENRGR